ncbi:MAG: hypothetical protein D6677_09365 [Calditrichaeota bacterium]|nr:MAG: hypothetical protein D6677_09365 [Calditrichota bacterium]
MVLSDIGQIVLREWNKTFEIRRELYCDCFVIMPKHIHAVVNIDKNDDIDVVVETHGSASLQQQQQRDNRASLPKTNESIQKIIGKIR